MTATCNTDLTIKNALNDILSIELKTLEAIARARAQAAESIQQAFRTTNDAGKNPSPWIRLAIQFVSRRNATVEHLLRTHFRPATANKLPVPASKQSLHDSSPNPSPSTTPNRRQRRAAARNAAQSTTRTADPATLSCSAILKDHATTLV